VDWNEMTTNHPRLIDACREVVHTADKNWARSTQARVAAAPRAATLPATAGLLPWFRLGRRH
jgi:hypothetical protein